MDWDDLRVVLAIGRGGTLAAAARELRVDHTTVGRRLMAIEQGLGARLFDRTPEGFRPTVVGDSVLARAREIEGHANAIEREVTGSDARPEGVVRLTSLDTFFDYFLVPRLGAFCEAYPGITLSLVSDVRLFDLSRREADIGIRYRKPRDGSLVGRRVGSCASGLYASRAYVERYGLPRGDGAGHALVGFPTEAAAMAEARTLERFSAARIAVRAYNPGHMLSAVRAGLGVGLIECHAVDGDPGLVRVVPEPVLRDELWTVVHVDMRPNARVRAVVEWVAALCAREADLLDGRCPQSSTGETL